MTDGPQEQEVESPTTRWRELRKLESWLEKPMLVLALLWLVLVVIELTRGLSPALEGAGWVIWGVFVAEFLLRLIIAPARGEYLRRNWLTILSLAVPALRIFRVFRVLRAARLLRASRAARGTRLIRVVGAVNRGMARLGASMSRKGFGYVIALTVLVVVAGAAGMHAFESGRGGPEGINDFPSALWWTAMIVTTMGSGYWPVTLEGRILCVMLSLYALGILGYLAAALAAYFVGRDDEESGRGDVAEKIEALAAQVAALRADIRAVRRD